MNIHHFEKLMQIFHDEQEEDSGGFPIDKFREVFGRVFEGKLGYDDITTLFMKIDANSDGTVTWDEFSTYMIAGTINGEDKSQIVSETPHLAEIDGSSRPHKDLIVSIEDFEKEKKFISVSRDGGIGVWNYDMKLLQSASFKTFQPGKYWVTCGDIFKDLGRIIVGRDDRRINVLDIFALKPRVLITIGLLDHAPTFINHEKYETTKELIVWGDTGGYIHSITFSNTFFSDFSTEEESITLDFQKLLLAEYQDKYGFAYKRRKLYNEWVNKVRYSPEITGIISCSSNSTKSLVIFGLDRKGERSLHVKAGVSCFEISQKPSFLITGSTDGVIRLWNPYVLNKPAGQLLGHNSSVCHLALDDERGLLFSADCSKIVMIWSVRTMQLVQSINLAKLIKSDSPISALFFSYKTKSAAIANENIHVLAPFKSNKNNVVMTSDDPVVAVLYNESFGQVVSVSSGVVKVWNLGNGEKLFQFNNLHNSEITSACFDKTHRRLLTACRGGEVKMWNFNNGQMLQKMTVSSGLDITHVMYIQTAHDKFILSAGWDKKISIFLDEPGNFNAIPFREFADIAYGHQCDILTADISSNHSVLATGDVGGQICIWNFDSGRLKAQFTINDIKSKGMRERSVEKLFFMPKANSLRSIKSELVVSTHADGFIRIWDYEQRVMIHESDCRFNLGDGIKSLKLSKGSEYIICGNLSGFVRVFKWDNTSLREVCSWMAHEGSCLSIDFIDEYACILTSSDDLTAKIWTLKGVYIGIFGRDIWNIDSSAHLKTDHVQKSDVIESLEESALKAFKGSKLGVTTELINMILTLGNVKDEIKMRERIIERVIVDKWLQYHRRHKGLIAAVEVDLEASNDIGYFSYHNTGIDLVSRKRGKVRSSGQISPGIAHQYLPIFGVVQVNFDDGSVKSSKGLLPTK